MRLVLVEALVVLGVVAIIAYAAYAMISSTGQGRGVAADTGSRWVATHYTVSGATRVAVRRLRLGTDDVLDEHVITEIPNSDPDFDTRFLEAMAQARARAALFESESD
jgi:hypothetical protein